MNREYDQNGKKIENWADNGINYWVEYDPRVHVSIFALEELQNSIPEYEDEKCPHCGNTKELLNTRNPFMSELTCPICYTHWTYKINRKYGRLDIVITKPFASPLDKYKS